MERPNNIDDLIRRRLRDAEVPPPAFVWPRVEDALRQRKRRFFIWLFAAAIAGAGIWTVWHRPVATSGSATPGAVQTPAPARSERSSAPVATISPAPEGAGLSVPPAADSRPAGSASVTRNGAVAGTLPAPGSRELHLAPVTRRDDTGLSARPEAASQATNPASVTPELTVVATPRATDSRATNAAAELLPDPLALLHPVGREPAVSPVAISPPAKKSAPKRCYDFHSNRQAWLLDAYAGPSFVRKQLDTGNPEFRDYVQDRLRTEKRQWAFNAGLRASYLFAENFIVRTGLHYDYFEEQFEFIDPNYIKYTVEITQKLVNGQWISVPDTVDVQYGANYVKTYNRFSLLDIPLQGALELRSGPTGISLNLGGSVNVLFSKRGKMLGPDGNPVAFTPADGQYDVYQPKVGLSLLGSIQWFYHVSPRIRVFAEPYYRYILEPVTKPGVPVKQSNGIGGVRIGVTRIVD